MVGFRFGAGLWSRFKLELGECIHVCVCVCVCVVHVVHVDLVYFFDRTIVGPRAVGLSDCRPTSSTDRTEAVDHCQHFQLLKGGFATWLLR